MEIDSIENAKDIAAPTDLATSESLTKAATEISENNESDVKINNVNFTDLVVKEEKLANEKDTCTNNVDSVVESPPIKETNIPIGPNVDIANQNNANIINENETLESEVADKSTELLNNELDEDKKVTPTFSDNTEEKQVNIETTQTPIDNNSSEENSLSKNESIVNDISVQENVEIQNETTSPPQTPVQLDTQKQSSVQSEELTNSEFDKLTNSNELKDQSQNGLPNEEEKFDEVTTLKNEKDDSTVMENAESLMDESKIPEPEQTNIPSTSCDLKSASDSYDHPKVNHINVKSNFEFAQVNLDNDTSQDNEKSDDRGSANSKGAELDPIAATSESMDTLESPEGVDEEVIIIPDSEREITEAEKQAASSLPTLKDISDKSGEELIDSETVTGSDIKIYNYNNKDMKHICCECNLEKTVAYHFSETEDIKYLCDEKCLNDFKSKTNKNVIVVNDEGGGLRVKNFDGNCLTEEVNEFLRKCASCNKITNDFETNLTWEIMDFCNEFCLAKYQKNIGSKCVCCEQDVVATSLGKYCVRFGNDIRQFCGSGCLETYKKGLKICSYCQKDMSKSTEGYLAPVGEKKQLKDFCSRDCLDKYDIMTTDKLPKVPPGTICSVCKTEKTITIDYEFEHLRQYFCGEPCFIAFAYVNKISPGKCAMCRRQFSSALLEKHRMYYDNVLYTFCSNSCENIYIIANRKIVPCSWCKVKKYNFDMIKKYSKTSRMINMCSINCLQLYQLSLNAVTSKHMSCNYCLKFAAAGYHLTMSDATTRNFCSYTCVSNFQVQNTKVSKASNLSEPIPLGVPQKIKKSTLSIDIANTANDNEPQIPVITHVQSLANSKQPNAHSGGTATIIPIPSSRLTRSKTTGTSLVQTVQHADAPVQIQMKQYVMIKEKPSVEQRNVSVMCSQKTAMKATQTSPSKTDIGIQTDKEDMKKMLIPIPIPIYIPAPCHMFTTPVPVPVPFPLPIPIPIFVPTTRNSAAGILKEIKKIQVKIPTDPYEAELLMMAEMVAEEKKEENTDSESDIDDNTAEGPDYSPEPVDTNNTFGDDMLQMALKMATELDEPAVDLEGALTANTITTPQTAHQDNHAQNERVTDAQPMHHVMDNATDSRLKRRKRGMRGGARGGQSKKGRRMSHTQEISILPVVPPPPPEPQEKPDANMCLKFTFGVNAWKQWVTTKNAELEKSSRLAKLFKTEILQLTADELNYSLCLFVKEVRKPNGQEYAPDTIYYLCLGIQQYLFENGRIDNIFCDMYYEKFTDCLDEVAKKFSVLYNDSQYIVTRVEEEHLWESKQLGAHSPHVLLSTLMFFNTKHFNLTNVDEHMQLSFSHIMKHWKRNPNQPGISKVPGSRNVLLRFYPPQSAIQNNQRKKKVYEQQENEENPLRCPVKLYEFYVSKCPESVKTRNDVFYLQPERSCVPDSPVWYSTMPLPKEALQKMLHRVKMVKEINVALLTS